MATCLNKIEEFMDKLIRIVIFLYLCIQQTFAKPILRPKRFVEFAIRCRQHNDFTWECKCPQRNVILTLGNSDDAFLVCGIDLRLSLLSKTPHYLAQQQQIASDFDRKVKQEKPKDNFWGEDEYFGNRPSYNDDFNRFHDQRGYPREDYEDRNRLENSDLRQYSLEGNDDVPYSHNSIANKNDKVSYYNFRNTNSRGFKTERLLPNQSTTQGGIISQEKLDQNLEKALSRFSNNFKEKDTNDSERFKNDQRQSNSQIQEQLSRHLIESANKDGESSQKGVNSKKYENSYLDDNGNRFSSEIRNRQQEYTTHNERNQYNPTKNYGETTLIKKTQTTTRQTTTLQPKIVNEAEQNNIQETRTSAIRITVPEFVKETTTSPKDINKEAEPVVVEEKNSPLQRTRYFFKKETLPTKAQTASPAESTAINNVITNDQANSKPEYEVNSNTDISNAVSSKNGVNWASIVDVKDKEENDKSDVDKSHNAISSLQTTKTVDSSDEGETTTESESGKDTDANNSTGAAVETKTADEETSGCYFSGKMISVGDSISISYSCKMICIRANMMKRDCSRTKTLENEHDPHNTLMNWHS